MSTAFSNALSGLNANSLAIDVVSGNLANLNTNGYKDNSVSFQDLINENIGGQFDAAAVGGSTIAQSIRSFSQGSLQTTSQPYDAAIQGNGFFVLQNPAGQQVFTRDGSFKVDASGHLVTQSGAFVQGWNATNGVLNTSGAISDIVLPVIGLQQPTPTANFAITANLNANATVGGPDATFSTPMPVIDSLGNTHNLTITYTKVAAGNWTYDVSIPSADLSGAAGPSTTLTSGTLTFDGTGHLQSPAAGSPIAIPISGLADGATMPASVNWNLYDATGTATITQYTEASANISSTQDGSPSGQVTSMSIGTGGQVLAQYSNGNSVAVAQLAVGTVLNPESMQDRGNNTFGTGSATSLPAIGVADTGSRGQITGGALESSTVDIAQEFTNLLTYERGYQANSKVITTEDQVTQATISLQQ